MSNQDDLRARLDAMVIPRWEQIGHPSPILALEAVACDLLRQLDERDARIAELESSLRAIFAVSIRHCTPTFNTITDAARSVLKGGQS